eukprot:TRINITY_DN4959_c0_g2_i1.p1 TRINITY_DN4959_c0_g2~~TRINITY_DN4959_c0_g2_i1.p1  ORF type:complete len:512 (+),score=54.02 TRINITY_DN4959_c0_g2_i1:75-1610(+)
MAVSRSLVTLAGASAVAGIRFQGSGSAGMTCPGSESWFHASLQVTASVNASCANVLNEMVARASHQNGWVDPHNGGNYSVISSSSSELRTQRTTNPLKAVGGNMYTDKQVFVLTEDGSGHCKIEGCSESQGVSLFDFSTNYCNLRHLYCGTEDGCKPVSHDFSSTEESSSSSFFAGHDFSQCFVAMTCPGSESQVHASFQVTAAVKASCANVLAEMTARASQLNGWVDPHNGGIYSVISSTSSELRTQRTTNPLKAVGGKEYTDKQVFTFTDDGSGYCKIEGCSESQGLSYYDFSTNYCNLRNLYCGTEDGCKPVSHNFSSSEKFSRPSSGAGSDFSQCIVPMTMTCPGSESRVHASFQVTASVNASCANVLNEMVARARHQSGWVDPHNGGNYSVISSSSSELRTQRTTNPLKAYKGKKYTDKQVFVLTEDGSGHCKIEGCSESQGFSIRDFSTNYCNLRNLYCGTEDGCKPVSHDFSSSEESSIPSIRAGDNFSDCIVHDAADDDSTCD